MCVLLSMRRCIVLIAAMRIVLATSSLQYGDATGVYENVKGTLDLLLTEPLECLMHERRVGLDCAEAPMPGGEALTLTSHHYSLPRTLHLPEHSLYRHHSV